jgi:hypothetical protein
MANRKQKSGKWLMPWGTSKQNLFARVYLVVAITNAVCFYLLLRNPQALTWSSAVWITAITLFTLTVNLEFWWRYQRQ